MYNCPTFILFWKCLDDILYWTNLYRTVADNELHFFTISNLNYTVFVSLAHIHLQNCVGPHTWRVIEMHGLLLAQLGSLSLSLRPCSHCRSCAETVPICRISGVCERAMSAIKLDLISENLIRSREGSVFRHNYLYRNKCNVNADYTYVGERWRCRLYIIKRCARKWQ